LPFEHKRRGAGSAEPFFTCPYVNAGGAKRIYTYQA